MSICFEGLSPCRISRYVEVTALASPSMLALCPVRVGTVTVPKMDIFVCLAPA